MSPAEFAADLRVLWRLARGQPRAGSHAERLEGFYGPQAERYDAFRARLLHGRADLLAALDIPVGSRVAELGCGTGGNLAFLTAARPLDDLARLYLVDLCPALLAVARRRVLGLPQVEVLEADATHWQPPQPVDRVFLSYSLTMMPDWPAVLANAEAMLAPGGRIGVVDFHLPADGGLGNRFWRAWFGHDGVRLSADHLTALQRRFATRWVAARRAPVPYLPGLRAPYYLFVGDKRSREPAAHTAAINAAAPPASARD